MTKRKVVGIGVFENGYNKNYEDVTKKIEEASKKAHKAIEEFKQGLDKAEKQAKQMLEKIGTKRNDEI